MYAFELFDLDGSGEITLKQGLRLITEALDFPLRKDEQRQYLILAKSGKINANQLLEFMVPRIVSFNCSLMRLERLKGV